MKAKDYINSVWIDNEGDMGVVQKVKGGYYIAFNRYDKMFTSVAKMKKFFKKYGMEHIGYE